MVTQWLNDQTLPTTATSAFTSAALTNAPSGSGGYLATGTAQGGTASTIQLASGSSNINSIYNGNTIAITAGTGAGQSRTITGYVGSTTTVTVNYTFTVTPDSTSVYQILASSGGAR
jgi:hypothetical protein